MKANSSLKAAGHSVVNFISVAGALVWIFSTRTEGAVPSCVPAPSGLVSWWKGEGNAADSAGTNNGLIQGGLTFAAGEVGQGFKLDGVNSNVKVPASASLDVGQANGFSVEAWINPADNSNDPIVDWTPVVNVANPTRFGVHFYANTLGSRNLYANIADTAGNIHQVVTANNVIVAGVFQHVAMTYDKPSGVLCIYLNGTQLLQTNITSFTPETRYDLNIGQRLNGAPDGPIDFNGIIDELGLYNRVLTAAEIQQIYAAGAAGKCAPTPPPVCVAPPSGLVSWWRAEGNTTDAVSGNNGTNVNGAIFVPGMVGQAFQFNGVNQYVEVPNAPSLNPTTAISLEAWVYISSFSGNDAVDLVEKGGALSLVRQYDLAMVRILNQWYFHPVVWLPSGMAIFVGATALQTGTWYHVAMTYDGSALKLYVNGNLDGSIAASGSILTSTNPLWMGGGPSGPWNFAGRLDDVSLYNRALSQSEIQAVFGAGSAGKCAPTPPPACVAPPSGLVSWWRAEGNANDTVDGNNAILSNGVSFVSGQVGQALSFDGLGDGARAPASASLNVGQGGGMTIEAWINPADVSSHPIVEWNQNNAFGVHFWLGIFSPGTLYVNFYDTAGNSHTITSAGGLLVANQFQHVAVTYDKASGVARLFLNGAVVQQSSLGSFTPQTSYGLNFGYGLRPPTTYRFQGLMDEVSLYSRALAINEVQSIYAAGSAGKCAPTPTPACVPPPPGLVSWWRAEGNALDQVGGNPGTLVNGVSYAPGMVGQAFQLNGINQLVVVSNAPSLNPTNAITLEGWVYAAGYPATDFMYIASKDGETTDRQYLLEMGRNGSQMYFRPMVGVPGGLKYFNGATLVALNTWNHVAMTYDGSNLKLYVNGVLDGSMAASGLITTSAQPLRIGRGAAPAGFQPYYFNGLIDELSFYGRALAQAEVQTIYAAGSAGKCVTQTQPFITSQPTNRVAIVGGKTTFAVLAGGTPPLTYQWEFDGANLGGATNASLVLTNLQFSHAGTYAVQVSNRVGSILSSNALLTVVPPPPCAPSPADLVGWWPGEGNANDVVGTNNGVPQGGLSFAPGEVGQAFRFDGVDSNVKVPASTTLDVGRGDGFTVEAWINPADSGGYPIVDWTPVNNSLRYGVHFYYSALPTGSRDLYANIVDTSNNNHQVVTSPGLIVPGVFQHVALTYDKPSGVVRMFVNGVVVQQASVGSFTPQTSYDLNIGYRLPGAPFGPIDFKGLMDEVSLYGRALSTNEILAIYNAGVSDKCKTPPGIMVQPVSRKVTVGLNATFAVTAIGTPTLHYQWSLNGTNIPGATSPSLTLTNVQIGNAGNYSVTVTNAFGSVTSSNAVLSINRRPVAVIRVSPLVRFPGMTNLFVISPNSTSAVVVLDGSHSYDLDGDALKYSWFEGTNLLSTNSVTTNLLVVGTHLVTLSVDDSFPAGTNTATIAVQVISPCTGVGILTSIVVDQVKPLGKNPQPFMASLAAACASFERGNFNAGINQLQAFQNKVRAQIVPLDAILAGRLINAAQQIIDALNGTQSHTQGRHVGSIHSLARQADGRVHLQFTGVPGEVYLIEASTNLVDWDMIDVSVDLGNGAFEFNDPDSAIFPARFYRVVTP